MPKLKLAIVLALTTAFISGTNNFLTKIAVTAVKDPIAYTFLKNAIVGVLLIGIILLAKKWQEIKSLNRTQAIQLLAISVIGGSLPFLLYFTGLSMIPAINAAFIHKTLFIWVALLAVPFLKERIGSMQAAALGLLLAGNLVMGIPKINFGTGELLVLAATLLWAIENVIAKKALSSLSSLTVSGARMALGSIVILIVVATQGKLGLLTGLNIAQWGWTMLTSLLLLGYVLTWYTALKYAPASLVASLLVPAVFVTNTLNAVFITHTITQPQLINGAFLMLGTLLLIFSFRKIANPHPLQNSQLTAPSN